MHKTPQNTLQIWKQCSHFCKKVCEFKHNFENSSSLEKHLQKVQVEAELNLDECEKLRAEIQSLQETIQIQKIKLANFKEEKTGTSRTSVKMIDMLKNTIKTRNSSMEEEKSKTLNLIALGQKQLRDKDRQIKTLQEQVTNESTALCK